MIYLFRLSWSLLSVLGRQFPWRASRQDLVGLAGHCPVTPGPLDFNWCRLLDFPVTTGAAAGLGDAKTQACIPAGIAVGSGSMCCRRPRLGRTRCRLPAFSVWSNLQRDCCRSQISLHQSSLHCVHLVGAAWRVALALHPHIIPLSLLLTRSF